MAKKVLIHICCGPCLAYPFEVLNKDGLQLHGFYYNPNIHPYTEHQRRLESVKLFAEKRELPLIRRQGYDLEFFLNTIAFRTDKRCLLCYRIRLEAAAGIARKGKFDAFTTTLLYSKFQKHDLIRETGEAMAKKYKVNFLYRDFRKGWKKGIDISKEMGLYRQHYCGCVYSEMERYYKKS